jgi:DNA-binding response OmpR family regulator
VRVLVSDRGPGIPEEFRAKIFGKFSQADASDSRQKGGTGLGLSIVRAIMEKHGGQVGFDSELGVGTTFYVTFPLAQERTRSSEPGDAAPIRRVLVCEDEPEVAFSIAATLRRAGFVPDIARTLAEARTLLRTEHYAALTLDLMLPDGDGVDLIREVRASALSANLPIVVVSADTENGQLRLNGGVTPLVGWLSKPVERARLLEVVRESMRARPDKKPRVLHVEDDPDVRNVVSSIARGVAEFDAAHSVSDAMVKLSTHDYSLVILDLELPDGSGWALLGELNRLESPPPVVIFSAHEVDARYAKAVAAALTKSNTSNHELLQVIERVTQAAGDEAA